MSASDNREMFDGIADYYDGTNRLLSLGMDKYWRRRAVSELSPAAGSVYLDVGAGTGDMAIEILRQAPGTNVVGIDPSEGMIAVGSTKIKQLGLADRVNLMTGDVLGLQFDDNTFAGAITAFCIRNVTHRRKGLEEIHRVVRGGGRLIILELTDPVGVMRPLFRIYSSTVMPMVTRFMSSVSAYRYLSASMEDFPNADEFAQTITDAGFENVRYFRLMGGIATCFVGLARGNG